MIFHIQLKCLFVHGIHCFPHKKRTSVGGNIVKPFDWENGHQFIHILFTNKLEQILWLRFCRKGFSIKAPIKRVRLKARSEKRTKKTTILLDDRFGCWHQPIVPGRLQPSIVGTSELNFCVRNGNRWTLVVINTNYFVSASSDGLVIIPHRFRNCKPFFQKN